MSALRFAFRQPTKNSGLAIAAILIAALGVAPAPAATPPAIEPKPLAPGAYFGLKMPGDTPELFAPGIINVPGRSVGHIAFSPDATECYFTVFDGIYSNVRLFSTRCENGAWTPQAPVIFVKGAQAFEPLFSRDGSLLYFVEKTTTAGSTGTDFWSAQRTASGWSEPQLLPPPLNSPKSEFCIAQAADGTIYFASNRDGGHGGLDIYRAVAKPGEPWQVENLGALVNSEYSDGDPGISPDGHILVFYSVPNRSGIVTASSDLLICFDDGHGGWTNPVNMGEGFNTPGDEYAATFSQDGRVLFFARFDGKQGQVYWVSTTALERFRKLSISPEKHPL
jgi:Tol biopolymer transport system component